MPFTVSIVSTNYSSSNGILTMKKDETLDQIINLALPRLEKLWQRASTFPEEREGLVWESLDQLSKAFQELYTAFEEIQQTTDELEAANLSLAAERRRYQELFEFAPAGYVVTDLDAEIQEANQAAARLLGISRTSSLGGKPWFVFVAENARRDFHNQLNQLRTGKEVRGWEIQLQPRQGNPKPASCTVAVVRDSQGDVVGLRWLLQDINKNQQAEESCRLGCHKV